MDKVEKCFVLTSRVDTSMEPPAIFSSFDKAYERMQREFHKRMKALKAEEEEITTIYIDEEGASIESNEYFEWRLDECILDSLSDIPED